MSIKINSLTVENVKRVKAVELTPTENGLTVIGGNNGQGKTSILDAITWALGGDKYRPSEAVRSGSMISPHIKIKLSNGLLVERSGKNSSLKVIDPQGNKSGQTLLNSFIEELALDLPKFMQASNKDKANTLLQIIGVGDRLSLLEREEQALYNERHTVGQIAERQQHHAEELPDYPDAPDEYVSAFELINKHKGILAKNAENERLRKNRDELKKRYDELITELEKVTKELEIAEADVLELHDESTAELEESIANIETINTKVRYNIDKKKAVEEAKKYQDQYAELTAKIEDVRKQKFDLLHGCKLPLDGLSVEDGELTYNGAKWDCMSGSDQLRVAVAIVRALKPSCGFVLVDKTEQMDLDTLNDFGKWLEGSGLQAICTRVSTGDECSILIEDGYASIQTEQVKYERGKF